MRTKIKVDGKYYRPVPWLQPDAEECKGCAFDRGDYVSSKEAGCINKADGDKGGPCDDGNEFGGMIFIRFSKEAMAAYVAAKLGADDDLPME